MKLNSEFYRLPVSFDLQRLVAEVNGFTEDEWRNHPQGYEGNTAMVLISANGGENDDMLGAMQATPKLDRCPYIRQILAAFNTVIGRSRLMRLSPRSEVTQHSDIHYYWHHRVRVHIPIITNPAVRFWCNGKEVHMGAGEAWVFDNWRQHKVLNPADFTRIHLVFDTVGSPSFWDLVHSGDRPHEEGGSNPFSPVRLIAYQPGYTPEVPTERYNAPVVMQPSEMDWLLRDMAEDLQGDAENVKRFQHFLAALRSDWRTVWAMHGDHPVAWKIYQTLRENALRQVENMAAGITMASNKLTADSALHSRLGAALNFQLAPPEVVALNTAADSAASGGEAMVSFTPPPPVFSRAAAATSAAKPNKITGKINGVSFDRPIFIVAAPRSGSTLLFETLANNRALATIGGESHETIESIPALNPAANQFHSNQLGHLDATPAIIQNLHAAFGARLQDADGKTPASGSAVRFLEKTPKNALRIPFLKTVFPDARFIFLHREPKANISSIMEAWRSGRFVTYAQLPGWTNPLKWSLLLIPGWRELLRQPVEQIAAQQWRLANQQILDDLSELPASDWCAIAYEALLAEPGEQIKRLCQFADIPFGARMAEVTSKTLPNSRYTLTPPETDKWRKNAVEIERVLPAVSMLAEQLRGLAAK